MTLRLKLKICRGERKVRVDAFILASDEVGLTIFNIILD